MITNDAKCLQSSQMIILIKLLVELKFLLIADPIYLLFTKYSWIFSTMANFPKYSQWLLDQAPWILVQLKFQVVADPETHLLNPALNFWSFTRETFYLLCCRRWNFLENYNSRLWIELLSLDLLVGLLNKCELEIGAIT